MAPGQPRGRWSLTSSLDPLLASKSPTVTLAFPATTPPSTHVEPPARLFQELLTRQLALPLYFAANFEPKCRTFPSVHVTWHLLDLTLRSAGGLSARCPSWLCLWIWLVGVSGSSSKWTRRPGWEQSPGVHRCRPSRPVSMVTGPPWAPLFSQLDGLSSVGLPCGCWCLTCPSLPLSPSLSLSLLVIVALLSSSVSPLAPSPSSPPFLLHLLSYVDGQGHSHRDFFSPAPKGVFGSAPGHSKGDAQSPRAGLGAGGLGLLSHLLSRLGRPRPPQCPAALVPSVDTEPS